MVEKNSDTSARSKQRLPVYLYVVVSCTFVFIYDQHAAAKKRWLSSYLYHLFFINF